MKNCQVCVELSAVLRRTVWRVWRIHSLWGLKWHLLKNSLVMHDSTSKSSNRVVDINPDIHFIALYTFWIWWHFIISSHLVCVAFGVFHNIAFYTLLHAFCIFNNELWYQYGILDTLISVIDDDLNINTAFILHANIFSMCAVCFFFLSFFPMTICFSSIHANKFRKQDPVHSCS